MLWQPPRAQYGNIPDSIFRSFLIAKYPSCFNAAGQIDTNCIGIFTEYTLNCSYKSIKNLDGLQYFKSLKTFECVLNQLTSLPSLPNSITTIDCSGNQLTSLPSLPNSLKFLDCTRNQLTSLPSLPNSLISLGCSYNQISSLPSLPNSLRGLSVYDNQLTSLPSLPNSLEYLYCYFNQITSLPSLPISLIELDCSYNKLSCLPKLPIGLTKLIFNGNNISCIPNTINPSFINPNNLPLCNPTTNSNGCVSFPLIQGNVYTDINTNNQWDSTEVGRERVKIILSNGASTFTQKNGYFEVSADSIGSYTVNISQPNLYKAVPTSYIHNFNNYDTVVIGKIAIQPITIKDSLSISAVPINWAARPGFSFPYLISSENVGTTITNPTINFKWDNSKLILDSISNIAAINLGNNISWSISNFVPAQIDNVVAYFRVKPTTAIGDSIKYMATIVGGTASAIDSGKIIVRGSYDPNDKLATPVLTPTQCALGKDVNYTIRFQNTGTDTAFTVVIADTLSNNVLPNTLQVINSSHSCKTTQNGNNVFFEFKNILLPDSNINEKKSHGFVNFTIKPKPTLINGNTIANKAYIYFDYNAPIITNTAITEINTSGFLLPVKIVSYQVSTTPPKEGLKNWLVLNKWTTATETNALLFNVQRSTDARTFKTFGQVLAKGSNNSYEFTDEKLPISTNDQLTIYYRLQIIDKDGSISYSEVRQINLLINQSINLFPNPAKEAVTVECKNMKQLLIIDYLGKTIKQLNITTQPQTVNPKQTININCKQLNKGIYIVQAIMNNGEVKSEKLIVE